MGCLGQVEAANPSQPNVQITHSNAAPNDLSGAVDPEPAFQKIGWRAEHTLEDMIDEVKMKTELRGVNDFVNRQYSELQWRTPQQTAGSPEGGIRYGSIPLQLP